MVMFNKLPYFVILQGKKYKINVDFRTMILFENKLQDKSVSQEKKIEYGLRRFYPAFSDYESYQIFLQIPQLYNEACEKLIWFYECGRKDYHKTKGNGKGKNRQIYSYEFDDEYIYGAFYEQYGIDLIYEKLHWCKFNDILKYLKDYKYFVKIK